MARQIVVLLLVIFAVVGLALAETPTSAPAPNNDAIGNTDDGSSGNDVVEAPVGGPVSGDVFPPTSGEASGPKASGAAALKAYYGVAGTLVAGAVAGFFSFY
ncbi:hypothetical protein I3760_05G172400 [Carya illinoinensis]|uniref:Transmembrane protein n=1 Tax=Carya illinoinensis TaxID=32201 RepID=A0A8T1QKN7_CARIL|nr:hypothetical protein I3760_05G172400 [Carya illinoinensis]KAG6654879.1 hypothetical protein CIPAW_05G176400 [Carya illinoinensis]KAG6713815.1 hypothetical protein I3842_05G172300 [Carya illinoinensis]